MKSSGGCAVHEPFDSWSVYLLLNQLLHVGPVDWSDFRLAVMIDAHFMSGEIREDAAQI